MSGEKGNIEKYKNVLDVFESLKKLDANGLLNPKFDLNEEDKVFLEKLFRDLGFFGPNHHINSNYDGLVYSLNLQDDATLTFVHFERGGNSAGKKIKSTMSSICISQSNETGELYFDVSEPDWRFEFHHGGVEGLYDAAESVALTEYMVTIVERNLANAQ
jgi:hypothetical protein